MDIQAAENAVVSPGPSSSGSGQSQLAESLDVRAVIISLSGEIFAIDLKSESFLSWNPSPRFQGCPQAWWESRISGAP
jgi:hypothetical protein